MKNREKQIIDEFIRLLSVSDLDSISVSMICDNLNIKRQTFYYHFQDIYELVVASFYSKRNEIEVTTDFEKNIELLDTFLKNNEVFCRKISTSFASDVLVEFINSYLYKSLINLFESESRQKEISLFFSKPIGNLIYTRFKEENVDSKEIMKEINLYITIFYKNEISKK